MASTTGKAERPPFAVEPALLSDLRQIRCAIHENVMDTGHAGQLRWPRLSRRWDDRKNLGSWSYLIRWSVVTLGKVLLCRQRKTDGLLGVNDGADAVQGIDAQHIGIGQQSVPAALQSDAVRRFTVIVSFLGHRARLHPMQFQLFALAVAHHLREPVIAQQRVAGQQFT